MPYNPGNALFRVAHEPSPGVIPVPASAGWVDVKLLSNDASNERTTIEDESIQGNAQASAPLQGEVETNAELEMNANAETSWPFLANFQEGSDTTSPDTGVYVHRLAPSGTDPVAETLAYLVSRDDGLPQIFREGAVSEFTLAWQRGGLLTLSLSLVFTRGDYWGSSIVVLDPAATPPPQIRGLLNYTNFNATDGDIFVKITGVTNIAATPPSFTCVAKIGAASSYGAVTFEAPIGITSEGRARWGAILDSNGTNASTFGSKGEAPEIHFPASTGGAANDEWRFDRERNVWTPAFSTALPFSGVYANILLDGEEVCIEQIEITGTLPVAVQSCLGRAFGAKVRRRGVRVIEVSIEREYLSLVHRKKLETAESFGVRLEAYSGVEFEPGYEHALVAVLPNIRPTGRTADVEDRETMSETLEGQAFPDPDNGDGYVDDMTLEITNSIADIATAIA